MSDAVVLLTVAQVAARAQVTPHTVRGWIHAGVLPGVQLGGHLMRVRETDLDIFLSAPVEPRTKATTA